MSNNHLIVTTRQDFKTLIRVADAMSYKHENFVVSAHGKQIQRACEIVALLVNRGRATVLSQDFGEAGDEFRYPTLAWHLQGTPAST